MKYHYNYKHAFAITQKHNIHKKNLKDRNISSSIFSPKECTKNFIFMKVGSESCLHVCVSVRCIDNHEFIAKIMIMCGDHAKLM